MVSYVQKKQERRQNYKLLSDKTNVQIAALQNLFFRRILGALARGASTNGETSMHLLIFSLKRFLGRRFFGFEFIDLFSLLWQGLYKRCGQPSFLRVGPNISHAVENNTALFFKKIFLKGTSPVHHSLHQRKTVVPLLGIFCFACLRIYPTITPTKHLLRHGESSYQL